MSRFIQTRFDKSQPHKDSDTIKQLKLESKTISKVRKRAKLEKVALTEIHIQLTLYAMREHLKQVTNK